MKRLVVLDKKVGETPLSAIEEWKRSNPEYVDVSASYAGRLDPMASGKLIVLLGDECKRQAAYTKLDKEYEIEVVLDVGSDTGDVLGLATYAERESHVARTQVDAALRKERGAHLREYPIFSSKTVAGKPLFLYALEGSLSSITIPEHIEQIYRLELQSSYTLSSTELEQKVSALLTLVPRTSEPSKRLGEDFRIDRVRAGWQTLFHHQRVYTVLRLRVTVASGAYMRSLAGRIGTSLGTQALALSIKRTKIGKYVSLWRGGGLWVRVY